MVIGLGWCYFIQLLFDAFDNPRHQRNDKCYKKQRRSHAFDNAEHIGEGHGKGR